jgi:hypothetical protein
VTLKDAVKIGQQYVIPENSLAWQDVLRLDWIEQGREVKQFYEEMSREPSELKEDADEDETAVEGEPLPESLKALFGAEDPKTQKLFLLQGVADAETPPLNPYLVPLGTSAAELGMEEESSTLNRDAVKRLALHIRRPVLYIDMISDPIEVLAFGPLKKQKSPTPFILLYTEEGPRILSTSKKSPQDVRPEQMPAQLKDLYEDRIGIQE